MRDTNQKVLEKSLCLVWGLLKISDVIVHHADVVRGHPSLHPSGDGAHLVLREVVSSLAAQQDKYLLQSQRVKRRALGACRGQRHRPFQRCERRAGMQQRRHVARGRHVVGQARGQGAGGHAIELGGLRDLDQYGAPRGLDGAHARRAVGTGARQDDGHGLAAPVLRERSKEVVNGQAQATRQGRFEQLQSSIQESHVDVGRHDVHMIGLQHYAVMRLFYRQSGEALHQLGQHAGVVRCQVLHQHEGHAGIDVGSKARKKGFKRRQAAS